MIFSGFILFIVWISTSVFSLLPDGVGWPASVHSYASNLGSYLGAWNVIFPVDTVITIISLLVALMLVYFGVQAMFWMYKLLRGHASIGGLSGGSNPGFGSSTHDYLGKNSVNRIRKDYS